MTEPEITLDEFVSRFADEMVLIVGRSYRLLDEDGRDTEEEGDTREYALEVAASYYEDAEQRAEGPEECARSDYSCWEF